MLQAHLGMQNRREKKGGFMSGVERLAQVGPPAGHCAVCRVLSRERPFTDVSLL